MQKLLDSPKEANEALDDFLAWRKKTRHMIKPAAAELTDEEINRPVHELR